MVTDASGWREALAKHQASFDASSRLPAAADRLLEAVFFATLACEVEPATGHERYVNWHVSAFIAALTGIREACKHDFERIGRSSQFGNTPIAKEFFLTHDAQDAMLRDPKAINIALWDLRNLRVHYGLPLVELRHHVIEQDLAKADAPSAGAPRWYLRPIQVAEIGLLRKPKLTVDSVTIFNAHVARRPLPVVLFQHLYNVSRALESSTCHPHL